MTVPMAPSPPPPSPPPSFRVQAYLPAFLAGWVLGAALTFLIRAGGQALLTTPCEGRTVLALLVPLLLGPGGLAFVALSGGRPQRAALGLGLVAASLLPGLFVGVQDIGALRRTGCAGGYIVFAPQGAASIGSLTVAPGGSAQLTGRIGGFQREQYPEVFTLNAEATTPGIRVTLPRRKVHAGETFPIRIAVDRATGLNAYTVALGAEQEVGEQKVGAVSSLEVNVQPRRD